MVLQDWYPVIALVVLLVLIFLLIFVILKMQKNHLEIQKVNQGFLREVLQTQTRSNYSSAELMDKMIALLGTKDPLSFQQVQAMNSVSAPSAEPVDNSDHGEMLQWVENNDELSAMERKLYSGIPEF